ncbi:uncharacterized protein JCM6883_006489 [Sporobolomyces salmoneus]|uniref:uncharacterized protein n=1 Tax=Sporobolomyces salmoneus TaxID=183962 RepID=UPI003175C1CD
MLLSSGVVYDQLTSDDGKCEVWVEPLVHKLLICFTILAHRFQNPLQFDDLQPFLDYAQQEVARYLDQVVHGTNPELALRLKDALELGPGF